jgi:tetratricopeptide (TPR) repeat protein
MSNTGVQLTGVHAQTISIQDVKVGSTAEELVAALESKGVLQTSELAGLQRRTIINLAHRLKPEVLDFEQAIMELERAVEVALDVIATGERGTNDDAFVNSVLARVAEKVRNDDLDGGAGAIDEALAELEAKHRRSQVVLLEEGVKVDTLRRDAASVARRIETIMAVDQPADRPAWLPGFKVRYDEFHADGYEKGINFSLSVASELARRMEVTARDSTERGTAANLLGNALWRLGEREAGTSRLEEAVAAYRNALKERPRNLVPLDWAETQTRLGTALWRLGERDVGTARLDEAVKTFRLALKERTRERAPLDWAEAQTNLGSTLKTLGEREHSTARLSKAVIAFQAALKERTRSRAPLLWAVTQNNLGSTLVTLGRWERGTARLKEGETAFRAALKEWKRDRVPILWAMATYNLGSTRVALGERKAEMRYLKLALKTLRAGLKESTRERAPLQWAATHSSIGHALWRLGEREVGTARLEEAVTAYREALKEYTREREPLLAGVQNNLGLALQTLGERGVGTAWLEEAVTAYREALKEYTCERVPLQWAKAQTNLGNALATLGERESGTARLEEAVVAWEACLAAISSTWPLEQVQSLRTRHDETQAQIKRRLAR